LERWLIDRSEKAVWVSWPDKDTFFDLQSEPREYRQYGRKKILRGATHEQAGLADETYLVFSIDQGRRWVRGSKQL